MKRRASTGKPSAFSLVEVCLALGIAAFCLVTLVGLLPVGLNSDRSAAQQSAAAAIATAVVADLRSAPVSNPKSPRYAFTMPATGAAATSVQTVDVREDGSLAANNPTGPGMGIPAGDARYRVCLSFVPQAGSPKAATMVRVLIVWPPQANPTQQQVPTKFSGSFEALFALDRN